MGYIHRYKVQNEKGFSLVEVLIAIAIFAVISVAVFMGLSMAARANIINDEITTSETLARSQIEYIQQQTYSVGNPSSYKLVSNGMVIGIVVNGGGSGYVNGDVVTISSASGTGFAGTVASAGTTGNVTAITVSAAGSGYGSGDTVTITSAAGHGFTGAVNVFSMPNNYTIASPVAFLIGASDTGIQRIAVTVVHGTKTVLTLEDYKVQR